MTFCTESTSSTPKSREPQLASPPKSPPLEAVSASTTGEQVRFTFTTCSTSHAWVSASGKCSMFTSLTGDVYVGVCKQSKH